MRLDLWFNRWQSSLFAGARARSLREQADFKRRKARAIKLVEAMNSDESIHVVLVACCDPHEGRASEDGHGVAGEPEPCTLDVCPVHRPWRQAP